MMTVKLKSTPCLSLIIMLNKLTYNDLKNYLLQLLPTSLKLVKIEKEGTNECKNGLSTVPNIYFRNANNAQNITLIDFEKVNYICSM